MQMFFEATININSNLSDDEQRQIKDEIKEKIFKMPERSKKITDYSIYHPARIMADVNRIEDAHPTIYYLASQLRRQIKLCKSDKIVSLLEKNLFLTKETIDSKRNLIWD